MNSSSRKGNKAKWSCHKPDKSYWIPFTLDRLIEVQRWLILHCYIRLGDQVWRQVTGIPMGFSCSPLWCNLYFASYEVWFFLMLAAIGRYDLMINFKSTYRYIDDLCILNHPDIIFFLDPGNQGLSLRHFGFTHYILWK